MHAGTAWRQATRRVYYMDGAELYICMMLGFLLGYRPVIGLLPSAIVNFAADDSGLTVTAIGCLPRKYIDGTLRR